MVRIELSRASDILRVRRVGEIRRASETMRETTRMSMTDVTVMTMTQCAKECERHARAKEAFVGARDAARARRGAESSTSGRDDGDDEAG